MIEFEILESPDKEMLGTHIHFKKILFFGRKQGDLLFQDPDMVDHHLRLEITEAGTICFKNKNIPHYLVNGKRTTGKKLIKINDSLKMGKTSLRVKNLQYVPLEKKGEAIKKNLHLILNDPSLEKVREIMEILEQDLAKLS